tara:strand:- start:297 stop:812 length:516 start_codon:yes stop_codon:yes gene_type:complete
MKRTTLATASIAAIAALALPMIAIAQPGDGHRGKGYHGPRGDMTAMIAEIDTNGDGNLSKEEVDAHRAAKFAEVDANGDGAVTQAEMEAHHEAERAKRMAEMKAKMFAKLDTDGNGTISAEEFNSREHPGFDKADADGDGTVTKEEMDAMRDKMKDRRGGWHKRGDGPRSE